MPTQLAFQIPVPSSPSPPNPTPPTQISQIPADSVDVTGIAGIHADPATYSRRKILISRALEDRLRDHRHHKCRYEDLLWDVIWVTKFELGLGTRAEITFTAPIEEINEEGSLFVAEWRLRASLFIDAVLIEVV